MNTWGSSHVAEALLQHERRPYIIKCPLWWFRCGSRSNVPQKTLTYFCLRHSTLGCAYSCGWKRPGPTERVGGRQGEDHEEGKHTLRKPWSASAGAEANNSAGPQRKVAGQREVIRVSTTDRTDGTM